MLYKVELCHGDQLIDDEYFDGYNLPPDGDIQKLVYDYANLLKNTWKDSGYSVFIIEYAHSHTREI